MTIALWVTAVVFGWARRSLVGRSRLRQVVFAGGVSTALTVIVGVAILKQRVLFTTNETVTVLDGDQIADFLTTALRPSDGLVSNAVVNYELLRRAPRLYASLGDPKQAARVVAVVHKSLGTKTEVCRAEEFMALLATAQDTADPAVLSNQIDLNVYAPPQVLAKFLTSTVYSLERRQNEERLPTGLDSGE